MNDSIPNNNEINIHCTSLLIYKIIVRDWPTEVLTTD